MVMLLSAVSSCVLKMRHTGPISNLEESQFTAALADQRMVEPRQDLTSEGQSSNTVVAILEGFAYRYKMLANGRRQITGVLLPGDFDDSQYALRGPHDHSVATITACRIALVHKSALDRLSRDYPAIGHGFQWFTRVELGTLREWLLSMGQRMADRQVAHLFCELLHRMNGISRVIDLGFALPFTQEELADILGLSTVHVNRVLQELRRAGLITLDQRRLTIVDYRGLQDLGQFDATYLHLPDPFSRASRPH